jgi:phosphonate transport system substrate-binding protein
MLAKRKETPAGFFGETFYTYSHDNSIQAVAESQADGAAVDSLIWEFMNSVEPEVTSKTRVVEKSPPYGIPPIVVHPDLDPSLKARLREVFLGLHEDEKAAQLLKEVQIERFVPADDRMYDSVREMRRWVAAQPGP